ncbi:expressed unknown protein [Seminavis robusta]|uniref:BTB domain-containing protein n=1 Tax=Seminavis robusta TaxID=568900 RepID=A0A9N8H2Q0_9STRA|nr:expressed unknown protein [Seminavis robusta]|eukprot:Sro12_g009630.1 n/a (548) ;mRNA; f:191811-193636
MPRLRSKKRKTAPSQERDDSPASPAPPSEASNNNPQPSSTAASATSDSNSKNMKGFVLQCSNGTLDINEDQAETLRSRSDFFRHAFSHNMQEAKTLVLSKPDWTKETAQTIVELLCQGHAQVPEDYEAFRAAADQILLPCHIPHPVYSKHLEIPKSAGDDGDDDDPVKLIEWVLETKRQCQNQFKFLSLDMTGTNTSSHRRFIDDDDDDAFVLVGDIIEAQRNNQNNNNNNNNRGNNQNNNEDDDENDLFAESDDDEDENEQERVEEDEDENQGRRPNNRPQQDRAAVNRNNSTGRNSTANVSPDLWKQFLTQGLLMVDSSKGFSIKLGEKEQQSADSLRWSYGETTQNYSVHYQIPLYAAITHITTALRNVRDYVDDSDDEDDDVFAPSRGRYRMCFQLWCGFYHNCLELTDELEASWEADFNPGGLSDDTTTRGSLHDLASILVQCEDYIVPNRNVKKIALFFHKPNWRTLGRLIHATQQCKDNPGTLLWDAEANDFLTMKTLNDTKTILEFLTKETSPLACKGDFQLTEIRGRGATKGNEWKVR